MSTKVLDRHIEVTPGLAGGKPHIAGHRITVQNIVIWHEHVGMSADEISHEQNLALSEIYAALTYYFDHREVIDASIREDGVLIAELRKRTPSILQERLKRG